MPPSILKPSRVDVPAPAPVIFVPTYIALVTAKPPERTTAAVVKLEASVEFVKVINPEPAIVVPLKLEEVIVLFERLSVPAKVARVPVVGNVTLYLQ